MLCPLITTFPDDILSRVPIRFRSVVLPLPLAPLKAKNSPFLTEKLILESALTLSFPLL